MSYKRNPFTCLGPSFMKGWYQVKISQQKKRRSDDMGETHLYITRSYNTLDKTRRKELYIAQGRSSNGARKVVIATSRRVVRRIEEYTRRWYEE